jgi:chromosome segregation ATPase
MTDDCVGACEYDTGIDEASGVVDEALNMLGQPPQAEHWCALCPTSHPTREALRKHFIAEHPPKSSDAARLRELSQDLAHLRGDLTRAQQDLAASQADLTRAERERDEARTSVRAYAARTFELLDERDSARAELTSARQELATATAALNRTREYVATLERQLSVADAARDHTRAESAAAAAELERVRRELDLCRGPVAPGYFESVREATDG